MSAKEVNELLDRIDALHDSLPEQSVKDVDWKTMAQLKQQAVAASKKMRKMFEGGRFKPGDDECMQGQISDEAPIGK